MGLGAQIGATDYTSTGDINESTVRYVSLLCNIARSLILFYYNIWATTIQQLSFSDCCYNILYIHQYWSIFVSFMFDYTKKHLSRWYSKRLHLYHFDNENKLEWHLVLFIDTAVRVNNIYRTWKRRLLHPISRTIAKTFHHHHCRPPIKSKSWLLI